MTVRFFAFARSLDGGTVSHAAMPRTFGPLTHLCVASTVALSPL
jgi:hypothetical protein